MTEKKACKVCGTFSARLYGSKGDPFLILNTKTGTWHSGGDWGVTDCGKDATRDHWRWAA